MKGWSLCAGGGLLVLNAVIMTTTCESSPGAWRRVAGDTTVVRTHSHSHADTARLVVVARYPLPRRNDRTPVRVSAMAASADGVVYLATDDGVIRRLRADGLFETWLKTDSASAPLPRIRAILVDPDGSTVARLANGDVITWNRGAVRGATWPAGAATGLNAAQMLSRAADGRVRTGLSPLEQGPTEAYAVAIATHLATGGALRDTVRAPRSVAQQCNHPPDAHFRSGGFDDIRVRYRPSLQWAPLVSGAMVIACNARYAFEVHHEDGRVTRVESQHDPVEVSADERVSFMAAWTLRMRNATDGPGPDWTWRGDSLPNHKPAFHAILTGSDGRIWIWPAQPSVVVPAPPQWVIVGGPRQLWIDPTSGAFDVFDESGNFVGRVAVPADIGYSPYSATPGPLIRHDTIWWITPDSTGAHALVRTHVKWPAQSYLASARISANARSTTQAGQ
jgi:hypothetical protein